MFNKEEKEQLELQVRMLTSNIRDVVEQNDRLRDRLEKKLVIKEEVILQKIATNKLLGELKRRILNKLAY